MAETANGQLPYYIVDLSDGGCPVVPTMVLSHRNGQKINAIENVANVKQDFSFGEVFEISFSVYEYADDKRCTVWDELTDFKLVYLPQYKLWFEIYVQTVDDNGLKKNVTGTHLEEAELSQIQLHNIEINTTDDLKAHEVSGEYKATVFYNEAEPKLSLLNRLLDKAPNYKIYHVDDTLKPLQRNFTFDGVSIADAFDQIAEEIECIFIYGEGDADSTFPTRTVSVYDLLDYCKDCNKRGNYDDGYCTDCGSTNISKGYGTDTTVFISNENLANELTSYNDTDSIKNCFYLKAGDDLMTATIKNYNFGSQYLWYLPEETRQNMTIELQQALMNYDAKVEYYGNKYEYEIADKYIKNYNAVVEKYKVYNDDLESITRLVGYPSVVQAYYDAYDLYGYLSTTMMPSSTVDHTSADEQAGYLTVSNMSPIGVSSLKSLSLTTANIAVQNYAKVYIDTSKYSIDVEDGAILDENTHIWNGTIKLTSRSDGEDVLDDNGNLVTKGDWAKVALQIQFNEEYETQLKQQIEKVIASADEAPYGIVSIVDLSYDEFKIEIRKHGLSNLKLINNCLEDALSILIDKGVTSDITADVYTSVYNPLLKKKNFVAAEIKRRENDIKIVYDDTESGTGMYQLLEQKITAITKLMSLQDNLGDDLWNEFITYRREDDYENENYISDGLNNKQLVKYAELFMRVANKEIKKSASFQHKIETNLKNLMVLPEFSPILHNFKLGNWLRVKVDNQVYKLRLASFSIDYDNLDNIEVTFSDVKSQSSLIASVRRTFAQQKGNSTSYDAATPQVSSGNIYYSKYGVVVKNYDSDSDTYETTQVRMLPSGVYYSLDGWATAKTAQDYVNDAKGDFAELMESASGLYTTTQNSEEGGIIYYMHDKKNLDDSTVIWKLTKDAWGVGQRDTSTGAISWVGGMTVDGDMLANVLSASGINASWINTGALSVVGEDNQIIFQADYDNKTVVMNPEYIFIGSGESKSLSDAVDDAVGEYKDTVSQYLTFDDDGLKIGGKVRKDGEIVDSDFYTRINNEQISFIEYSDPDGDGVKSENTVAYINDDSLSISNANIDGQLAIGQFAFIPHTNGSVSLVWKKQ